MNSLSRQWAFDPLALPLTQFLYEAAAPPLIPVIATETAAALDPTQGCAVTGETGPFVHWLRLADDDADDAVIGIRAATNAAAVT